MEINSDGLSDEPTKLSFQLLKEITNNFDPERKIGAGTSGEVYKGVFKDGKVIAVKMLRFMPLSDDKQFQNEFEHLKRLKHQNIVQLVGICDETEEVFVPYEGKIVHAVHIHRALCLEFVPNGGLGKFLSEKDLELNWHTCFRIIQGTCQGLKYLHDLFTMHFDLKPDNILLDAKMMPKIADFGLSRLLGEENTVRTKTPLGTIGYLPPEFINKQIISKEYDIFSLGIIIKRIVTGMDYWNISHMDDRECIEHVYNNWRKRLQEIPAYAWLEVDCKQVRTCVEIAVDCTQEDPRERPNMNSIVCRLSMVEGKENDSQFHDGQFFFPVPERPSPELEGELVKKELEGEDNPTENRSLFHTSELPFEFLREITNNFSTERIVSQNAFATVFKGILRSGENVAVKRFGESYPAASDIVFREGIGNLMEVEHQNVLQLIGFCYKKKRKKVVKHGGRYILTDKVESYLCHEYAQNGSLEKYMYDEYGYGSCQLDWNTRFKIIMGICEGVHFLPTKLLIDTPLSVQDILLDSNMVPKLSNVGVSELFYKLTEDSPEHYLQATGDMAPEYLRRKEIRVWSNKHSGYVAPEHSEGKESSVRSESDIYRLLGLLIMKIATGLVNEPSGTDCCDSDYIDTMRLYLQTGVMGRNYSIDTTCIGHFYLCIKTGLQCVEANKRRRSIPKILEALKSAHSGSLLDKDITSSSTSSRSKLVSSLRRELSSYQSRPGVSAISPLSMLPRRLCFPLEPKRLTSSLVYLTNNTKDRIAFQLLTKTPKRYHTKLPLCGIVPPECTYTLTVAIREQKKQILSNNEECLTLQCSIAREEDLKNVDPTSIVVFFKEAKEKTYHEVQEMMLPVVCDSLEVSPSDMVMQLEEIIDTSQNCRAVLSVNVHLTSQSYQSVMSIDVHPKEPWILTSNNGDTVCIWNYQKQEVVNSFEVSIGKSVYSAKFIERKDWLVAGDGDGYIHVYSYDTMEEVKNFEAHDNHIISLAVNPTYPFVLSASDDHLIKLWDWNKGWECIRTFEGHYNRVTQVMFHPKNDINFASASLDRKIKIWNIFSGNCNITLGEHPNGLLCIHYFEDKQLHYIRQLLIVGSSDGAAKVWDPETHSCVGTLEGHTDRLSALCWLPKQEVFVTGSLDGTVQIWKPAGTTYRPENIVGLNLGAVNALGYIKESRRIVVGCEQGLAMVEIN